MHRATTRTDFGESVFNRCDEALELAVGRSRNHPVGLSRHSQLNRATLHRRAEYHRGSTLTLLSQIPAARSIEVAIPNSRTDRTGGILGAAKQDWRGVTAEQRRKCVVPTA